MAEIRARVVFCDDIRQEFNGKLILIGVYSGEIRLQAPFIQPMATWIQIFGLPAGDHKTSVTVTYEDGKNSVILGKIDVQFQISDAALPAHAFPTGLLVNFDRPGDIVVNISIDDQPTFIADRLRVSISENS